MCQSYPQINTGGHTKTPLGSVDRPDGLVHQQHQTGWKAGPVFEQLGTDHTRPMGLTGHIRVPNRAKQDSMASKAHARDKMLQGGAGENLTGGSRTYGQGCYSGDNTVQKQFCVPNLSCGKEGRGTEASNKPQEPQHLCKDRTFQNGGSGYPFRPHPSTGLDDKNGSEGCLPSSSNPQGRPAPPAVSTEREDISVPVPSIQVNLSTAGFSKVMKPVVGTLRHMGIRLIIYLDNILILHQVKEELIQITTLICQMLEALGLVINQKSQC